MLLRFLYKDSTSITAVIKSLGSQPLSVINRREA